MRTLAFKEAYPERDRLAGWLKRFPTLRIAVVGDFFLDRYLVIDPRLEEPSLETRLPAHQVVEIRDSPGAAGTVTGNLVALSAGELRAVGAIGDDAFGFELRRRLERLGVDIVRLIVDRRLHTPTYLKPVARQADGDVELPRLDIVNRTTLPADLSDRIWDHLQEVADQVDAVILLDQVAEADCGVIGSVLRRRLPKLARRHPGALLFVDSRAYSADFAGVVIKANHYEGCRAAGIATTDSSDDEAFLQAVSKAGKLLSERSGKPVLLTMGPRGILVTEEAGQTLVPGSPVSGPIDVTGAGDSATAGFVLARCAGASLVEAAAVANLVASITVRQLGSTGTATPQQVLERYDEVAERQA